MNGVLDCAGLVRLNPMVSGGTVSVDRPTVSSGGTLVIGAIGVPSECYSVHYMESAWNQTLVFAVTSR